MIKLDYYEGLPMEYETFLIERYGSYATTNAYLKAFFPERAVNYVLVYEDNRLVDLLLYEIRGAVALCFNSIVDIARHIITEFRTGILDKYPSVKKLSFSALYTRCHLPKQILDSVSENYVITLPATIEEYYSQVGYNTRQHVRNRRSRFLKNFPAVEFVTRYGREINQDIVNRIIQLNIDRMRSKGVVPGRNEADMNNLYRLALDYGCVSTIELEGKVVAGCISVMLGKTMFAIVVAHDNSFSKYSVGEICAFYLIEVAIGNGLTYCNLLWGKSEMKDRMLARPVPFYSYSLYRDYSLDFLYSAAKVSISRSALKVRQSSAVKPLREAVKSFRKRLWTRQK